MEPDASPVAFSPLHRAWAALGFGLHLFWQWSVPHRNSHRPDDPVYAAVWGTAASTEVAVQTLQEAYPELSSHRLPTGEEEIRSFLRKQRAVVLDIDSSTSSKPQSQLPLAEEAWEDVPFAVRRFLAASNAMYLEKKLDLLLEADYHPSAGTNAIRRSTAGINKTFRMWRHGFKAGTSLTERIAVRVFFVFLTFSAMYPDVAAGFLGERSYNQRSIGSRIMTLIQLFFLWTYPYHSFWLLFNWSLERLLGALVGNSVYALAAIVPRIRALHPEPWFRTMILVLSLCWQITVQFTPAVRDSLLRLATRRQMAAMRSHTEAVLNWDQADEAISHELVPLDVFSQESPIWHEVPLKVRVERYIQFTHTFVLGRSADQLIALLKDGMETVISTYEDYRSTMALDKPVDMGHVEPRLPKQLLVFLDIAVFSYVCYSFYPQPFTFNTVVAYSTVVIIKQTILALKRYQTIKSARRLFTNMVSVNILGMLLVSLPVTIDRNVLAKDGNMVALTLAMVFATLFLAEPIGPLLLWATEKIVALFSRRKTGTTEHTEKS